MMADYKPVWAKQLREALSYCGVTPKDVARSGTVTERMLLGVLRCRGSFRKTLRLIEDAMLERGYALHFAGISAGRPDVSEFRRRHVLDTAATEEDAARVWDVVEHKLTPREATTLRLRFEANLTLQQCAAVFCVTKERVRQVEAKALRKLRHPQALRLLEGLCSVAS